MGRRTVQPNIRWLVCLSLFAPFQREAERTVWFFGNGKCELSAILRGGTEVQIFGEGKCNLTANFSATRVRSLPSLFLSLSLSSLSLSLSLSLSHTSPRAPQAQYTKPFRAWYNTFLGSERVKNFPSEANIHSCPGSSKCTVPSLGVDVMVTPDNRAPFKKLGPNPDVKVIRALMWKPKSFLYLCVGNI